MVICSSRIFIHSYSGNAHFKYRFFTDFCDNTQKLIVLLVAITTTVAGEIKSQSIIHVEGKTDFTFLQGAGIN